MSIDPVRIAVVGAGLVGHRHIEHIINEPRCTLAGVVDPDHKAASQAEQAGAPYYSDIKQFLHRERADGAIIATPNQTHAVIGSQCAAAGIHILVEKPIDADPGAAAQLIETAKLNNISILVGHHRRFNPYVAATKRLLDEGRLGTIISVNVLWTLLKPAAYFQTAWRREPGGGPIFINTIHDIDTLRYLFGDIHRIFAEMSTAARGYAVEDTAAVTLRFENGVLGTGLISDAVASPYSFEATTGENPLVYATGQDCYRIFGSQGTLSFPDMRLWSYGQGPAGWAHPLPTEHIDVAVTVPLEQQLRHFCDIIRENVAPRCSGEDGLKTLQTTMAIGQSARSGRPVCI